MRVLLTTDTIGGVWTFTKELTTELLHLGHSIALVSFGRDPSRDQRSWCMALENQHQKQFRYDASNTPLEWMNPNDSAYRSGETVLLRVAEDFHPDLLHSNQFCFGRLPLSIPRLITAHSDVLSWGAACRPHGFEPTRWLTDYCTLVSQGLDASNAVVAPTKWMLDALTGNFSVPARKSVILNGRRIPYVRVEESRALQAVSAGRVWDEAKNLAMLGAVHTTIPIVVAGEQKYKDTAAPACRGNIDQIGPLSEPDLMALFRASSIYLATSIYEPFGLAPLEAALCGCAVVANDIPSLREVWGNTALYFRDAASLSDLLAKLQDFPELLLEARRRAANRALELTAARMTMAYLNLYTELLSSKEPPRESAGMEDVAQYAS